MDHIVDAVIYAGLYPNTLMVVERNVLLKCVQFAISALVSAIVLAAQSHLNVLGKLYPISFTTPDHISLQVHNFQPPQNTKLKAMLKRYSQVLVR